MERAGTQGGVAEGHEGDPHPARSNQPGPFHLSGRFSSSTERFPTPPPRFALAATSFFGRIEDTYGDRIFAFDHFSVSRTPEQNARARSPACREQRTTFDVVTHSRGGLVLRNLVERAGQFGDLSRRFVGARGPGGVAERWHAARDAETMG